MGTWLSLLLAAFNQSVFCYNKNDIVGALGFQEVFAELGGTKIQRPVFMQESAHIDMDDRLKLERAFHRNNVLVARDVRKYVDAWNAENKNFFKAGKQDGKLTPEDFNPNQNGGDYLPK
jgi:hypothetical protein